VSRQLEAANFIYVGEKPIALEAEWLVIRKTSQRLPLFAKA
jgi:hypothetical protein